jgi:hypothetical protein
MNISQIQTTQQRQLNFKHHINNFFQTRHVQI